MEHGRIPGVRKIAVLRPSALGDFIFVVPALEALREAYPEAEIVYLGAEWHTHFLPGRFASVDRVEIVPQTVGVLIEEGKRIDADEQEDFFARMQKEAFDLALQVYGGGRYSNPFLLRLEARVNVGAKAEDAVPLDRWTPYIYYQHETLRNLDIVALAGATTAHWEPRVPVLPGDLEAAAPALAQIGKPFVVIHPGATDVRRCWATERFAQVADHLAGRCGLEVVLTGIPREAGQVQEVADRMRQSPINLCGQLSKAAMVGLLSRAELVVTNNTGPLHVALGVGTKAVGLFWVEQVVNTLPLSRAHFYPLIAWDRRCPACGTYLDKTEFDNRNSAPCAHRISLLGEISVSAVIEAAERMLILLRRL